MHHPVGYVKDDVKYLMWLQAGLKAIEDNK
jgi:hypothetical protein